MTVITEIESDGDSDHQVDQTTAAVQLGFVVSASSTDSTPLSITSFPTKIGGLPLWLDPSNPLPAPLTTCQSCQQPMILLMQIYTAEDFPEEAYHRYLYIFVCRRGACHQKDWRASTRVFRAQLGLENQYYSTNPETEQSTYKPSYEVERTPTCAVCGVKASYRCTNCRTSWYCSKTHQGADWTFGGHSHTCATPTRSSPDQILRLVKQRWIYPEIEIYTEVEVIPEHQPPIDQLMPCPPKHPSRGREESDISPVKVDPAFIHFQSRIRHFPSQVFRYVRVDFDNLDPKPLLVSNVDPPPQSIPPCNRCGSVRTLECQILSTLLTYLPLDLSDPSSFDFGTFFIYTCLNNCSLNGDFANELIYRQDFSADGIQLPYSS